MLKLVLADILTQFQTFGNHFNAFGQNLVNLKNKLPDMSKFTRKSISQIQREIDAERGPTEILNLKNEEDDNKD
ncbi:MAG: hypothetical protein HC836_48615 [Richelia sp. RM2_1_2]|nr:hypothetical protein [Richelia sp. RM2_1_2]